MYMYMQKYHWQWNITCNGVTPFSLCSESIHKYTGLSDASLYTIIISVLDAVVSYTF